MEVKNLKIAILILAHKNLEQLSRLVRHLQSDFDVFLHVDKKSDIPVADFQKFGRVKTIKKVKTGWGSLGIVSATLELYSLAQKEGSYDRFVLISGQDVPLKPNKEISSFFSRNGDVDFIDFQDFSSLEESRLTRVTRFHFFSRRTSNPTLTQWLASLSRLLDGALHYLGLRRSTEVPFRWGSQWMDLTGDTVTRITQFIRNNPRFLRRFRFTFCPDEVFFQTVLAHFFTDFSKIEPPRRFIDWNSGPEKPRVLRLEDIGRLEASGMLFARKCEAEVDSHLIDILYERLQPER